MFSGSFQASWGVGVPLQIALAGRWAALLLHPAEGTPQTAQKSKHLLTKRCQARVLLLPPRPVRTAGVGCLRPSGFARPLKALPSPELLPAVSVGLINYLTLPAKLALAHSSFIKRSPAAHCCPSESSGSSASDLRRLEGAELSRGGS